MKKDNSLFGNDDEEEDFAFKSKKKENLLTGVPLGGLNKKE